MKLGLILSVLAFPSLLVVALAPPNRGRNPFQAAISELRNFQTNIVSWGLLDPHTNSKKNNYEICDYYSESPISLFEYKGLSISGSLPRIEAASKNGTLQLIIYTNSK